MNISLTLVNAQSTITLGKPTPAVAQALQEVLRGPPGPAGPPGAPGEGVDFVADPLAYYILAKS